MDPFAHSRNTTGERQSLAEHSQNVAALAAGFCTALGAEDLGSYLGLIHDLGKLAPAFQDRLLRLEAGKKAPRVDHKRVGAKEAYSVLQPLAMVVQGHHGGLRSIGEYLSWMAAAPQDLDFPAIRMLGESLLGTLAFPGKPSLPSEPCALEFFLRMLFSALVDADFLDTEQHFSPQKSERRMLSLPIADLAARIVEYQTTHSGLQVDIVGRARHEIYEACLARAAEPPGIFRLTVPTGGGKTRSGMAFALEHARLHGLRRVIVAVPFITITEQTAGTYRSIFESKKPEEPDESKESEELPEEDWHTPIVLEHHSGVRPELDDPVAAQTSWRQLTSENWDAPIVVTTTV